MADHIQPRCPFCNQLLEPGSDILWDNAGVRALGFKGCTFIYCGLCGAVLGGGSVASTLTKTRRG